MHGLKRRFVIGKVDMSCFPYIGFGVYQTSDAIVLDQSKYASSLSLNLPVRKSDQNDVELSSADYTKFRSVVGQLNWVAQGSRPDMSFDVVSLSTKFNRAKYEDMALAVKAFKKVHMYPCKLVFPKLNDIGRCHIVVYADASLGNLDDGVSSVGGHVVFLLDDALNCCTLSWQGNKIKRVVRSTLAAETLSLVEGLEDAIYHRQLILEMMGNVDAQLAIDAVVDNKSVFDSVHSTKLAEDRRLRRDLGSVKELLQTRVVRSLTWRRGKFQLANCLTKRGADGQQLLSVLQSGKLPGHLLPSASEHKD